MKQSGLSRLTGPRIPNEFCSIEEILQECTEKEVEAYTCLAVLVNLSHGSSEISQHMSPK